MIATLSERRMTTSGTEQLARDDDSVLGESLNAERGDRAPRRFAPCDMHFAAPGAPPRPVTRTHYRSSWGPSSPLMISAGAPMLRLDVAGVINATLARDAHHGTGAA